VAETDAKVAMIVAMDENGVIGREGALPWRLSSDLKLFKRLTMGKPLIMGRKTFQSIGKPLEGRDNIVVTRNVDFAPQGVDVAPSPKAALWLARGFARARGASEIMVIGGADIFEAFLPETSRIYLTRVHANLTGDTYFPALPPEEWRTTLSEHYGAGARDDYAFTFTILDRVDT
jgi:dihydrofolate reductase